MKTITIANQKGGVGKSTVAVTMCDGLRASGRRVLFVDTDPQANSTSSFHAETDGVSTYYDLLKGEAGVEEVIQHTEYGDIIPSDHALRGIEETFAKELSNYLILKKALEEVSGQYDYGIIDTSPNLGFFLTSAMIAADGIVIPVTADDYAISGLQEMLHTCRDAKTMNPNLRIYGILLNRYDRRNSLDRSCWEQLPAVGQQLGVHVFSTPIRVDQKLISVQRGLNFFQQYPSSHAAEDFAAVIVELVKEIEGNGKE